jgi:hypothetical protein
MWTSRSACKEQRISDVNLLGNIARMYIPTFLKRRELMNLFAITGSAFGAEVPGLDGFSYDQCLTEYARFTKAVVDRSIDNLHNLGIARQELCHRSFDLGNTIRKTFAVTSTKDVMTACRVIYRCLGIDFRGTVKGGITICDCFFSNYYSEQVCGVISCLDKGLVAGLSGGGKLSFTQKITEGMDCCRAEFIPRETTLEDSNCRGHGCWWCNCC